MLGDMGNQRAVRILLECILVLNLTLVCVSSTKFKYHWRIDQPQSKFSHFYGVFMRNLDKMVAPPPQE